MNDIVGYAIIKADAKIVSNAPASDFHRQTVRVMEFAFDGGALVVNDQATGLAMIEPEDILRSFKCSVINNLVVCPPDLSMMEQMFYHQKAVSRRGGYNYIVKQMVIAASLHRGEFTDSILWAKQNQHG